MTESATDLEKRLEEDLEKSLTMVRNAENINLDTRIFAAKRLEIAYHNIINYPLSIKYKKQQLKKIADFYLERGDLGYIPSIGSVYALARLFVDERRGIRTLGDVFRQVLDGYSWIEKYIDSAGVLRAVGGKENLEEAKQLLSGAWNIAVIMGDEKYRTLLQYIEWEASP